LGQWFIKTRIGSFKTRVWLEQDSRRAHGREYLRRQNSRASFSEFLEHQSIDVFENADVVVPPPVFNWFLQLRAIGFYANGSLFCFVTRAQKSEVLPCATF
jgi:hypothetical protein